MYLTCTCIYKCIYSTCGGSIQTRMVQISVLVLILCTVCRLEYKNYSSGRADLDGYKVCMCLVWGYICMSMYVCLRRGYIVHVYEPMSVLQVKRKDVLVSIVITYWFGHICTIVITYWFWHIFSSTVLGYSMNNIAVTNKDPSSRHSKVSVVFCF